MPSYYDYVTEGISIPLTRIASGYKPQGLIADQVFPVVPSLTRTGKIPIFNKDAFKIYNTYRARLAKSNRATISPDSWVEYACAEHDLAIPMDQMELDELKNIPGDSRLKAFLNIQDRTRRRVQWNMALEKEKVVADAVQSTANYTAGHTVTLATTGCWSEAGSDPVGDIEAGRQKIRAAIGAYPNTMILGVTTEEVLKFHSGYTNLMKLTNDKVVRMDLVAKVHNIDRVIIGMSMAMGDDVADDAAAPFSDLWDDFLALAYIPKGGFPDLEEPCWGYTIRPSFSPKPFPYVDIFTEEGGKLVNVRCTDNYVTKFVNGSCGYLIKNTKL